MIKGKIRQATAKAMLICDGVHGIYAPQSAVRILENMRENGALDLHIPPLSEFALADITKGPLDPDHDYAWDTIQEQLNVTIDGVDYFIHENRDIWLIPCDWEWSEEADFYEAPRTA